MYTIRALTLILIYALTIGQVFSSKLVEVKPLDNRIIVITFRDGEVEFRDDGNGDYAFYGHHNDETNNWVVNFGKPLDVEKAQNTQTWFINSDDDPDFTSQIEPIACFRKSKLNGMAQLNWNSDLNDYNYEYTHEHKIYLKLPFELKQGKRYKLHINGQINADKVRIDFVYDVFNNVSDAIHTNLVGYSNTNSIKSTDIYHWMGDGKTRDYSEFEGKPVFLYNVNTKEKIKVSELKKASTSGNTDVGSYNLIQSDVWHADFKEFNKQGTYRLVVEGIGCSNDFEIKYDIYKDPFKVATKGYYYMRIGQESISGIKPEPRIPLYIPNISPENCKVIITKMHPFHPEWSSFSSGDAWDKPLDWEKYSYEGNPENPNAYGAHSDAFDWDRHLAHVSSIYDMLLPYILTKGALNDDNIGIAESGNGIPDIIDEARYEVDFWLRLRHGKGYSHGLTCPTKSNVFYQAENTTMTAFANALNASMLAYALQLSGNGKLAKVYADSAMNAYNFGISQPLKDLNLLQDVGNTKMRALDFKMSAAAYLYNLTGNRQYENDMMAACCINSPTSEFSVVNGDNPRCQTWGIAAYLSSTQKINYKKLYKNMQNAVLYQALKKEVALSVQRPSRRSTDEETGYFRTVQNVQRTIIAHAISKDADTKAKLMDALVLEADWSLGRNPLNMIEMTTATTALQNKRSIENCYTTGRNDGSPGLHPGHTPYLNLFDWAPGMVMGTPSKLGEQCYPNFENWPVGEAYFNTRYVWAYSEFTPQQTMRGKSALYGYLYGVGKQNKPIINAQNPYHKYYKISGRNDLTIEGGPVLYYAGSIIQVKFEGTSVKAGFTDYNSTRNQRIGYIIDNGHAKSFELNSNSQNWVSLAKNLKDGTHELLLFKMTDCGHGTFGLQFNGLQLDEGKDILPVMDSNSIKFEFYGDSFTAGVGSDCPGDWGDCRSNNGYYGYANVCARILNADIFNNGIGGLAVIDSTGWYQNQTTGFQTTYNKLCPSNESGNQYTEWDFSRYTPDVLFFAFGINDNFGRGNPFADPENWKAKYKELITHIIEVYKNEDIKIVVLPGNIQNEAYTYAPQVVDELKAMGFNACYFQFSFTIDAHPSRSQHKQMGEELAKFVSTKILK